MPPIKVISCSPNNPLAQPVRAHGLLVKGQPLTENLSHVSFFKKTIKMVSVSTRLSVLINGKFT